MNVFPPLVFILLIGVAIYLIRRQCASSAQTKRIVNLLKGVSKIKYPARRIQFDCETATLNECTIAAKQGHSGAQFKLGKYYFEQKSMKCAEYWFALASAQGCALASAYLGMLLMMHDTHGGNSVAIELFKLAHAQVDHDLSIPDEVKPLARQQILNAFEATLKQDRKSAFIPYISS